MGDDFKLSVDIEANLTKLDQSLNMAQQKVSQAGQRMQSALFGAGVGGQGGGGFTGASPIATQNAASGHVSGSAVSFGGGANMVPGNTASILEMNSKAQRDAALYRQMQIDSILGPRGGSLGAMQSGLARLGISAASPLTMAVGAGAAAITGGNYALPIAIQSQQLQFSAQAVRGVQGTGAYAAGETFRQLDYQIENMQAPGNLAIIPGANTLTRNLSEYLYNKKTGHPMNFGKAADVSDEIAGFRREVGIGFGGYVGEKAGLDFERQQFATKNKVTEVQLGSAMAKAERDSANTAFDLRRSIIERDRSVDLLTLEGNAQMSQLNAFGAGGVAKLIGIRTQFQAERLKTNPNDAERLAALNRAESSASLEAITSGLQPGQEFTPGMAALGSNEVAGFRGQESKTIKYLMNIDRNLGAGLVDSLVGRN